MTGAGFAFPAAEAVADMCRQVFEHNLATKQAIAALRSGIAGTREARAQFGTNGTDRYFKLYLWIVGTTINFGIYVLVLIKYLF